jgi:hypothetical protein
LPQKSDYSATFWANCILPPKINLTDQTVFSEEKYSQRTCDQETTVKDYHEIDRIWIPLNLSRLNPASIAHTITGSLFGLPIAGPGPRGTHYFLFLPKAGGARINPHSNDGTTQGDRAERSVLRAF